MNPTDMPVPDRKTSLGSFLAGVGTLASIWPVAHSPVSYPHRSETEALRGDAIRIGDDMRRVIERERARIKATS